MKERTRQLHYASNKKYSNKRFQLTGLMLLTRHFDMTAVLFGTVLVTFVLSWSSRTLTLGLIKSERACRGFAFSMVGWLSILASPNLCLAVGLFATLSASILVVFHFPWVASTVFAFNNVFFCAVLAAGVVAAAAAGDAVGAVIFSLTVAVAFLEDC